MDTPQDPAHSLGTLSVFWDGLSMLPPRRQVLVELLEEQVSISDVSRAALYQACENELSTVLVQMGVPPDLFIPLYELARSESHYQRKLSFPTSSTSVDMWQRGSMGAGH